VPHEWQGCVLQDQNPLHHRTIDVALKIIPKTKGQKNESAIWDEIAVLDGLDHPNIVSDDTNFTFSLVLILPDQVLRMV
jgi:hypothetical protein